MEPRIDLMATSSAAEFSKRFAGASLAIVRSTLLKATQELIGVFQAAMLEAEFAGRWLDIRAEALGRIGGRGPPRPAGRVLPRHRPGADRLGAVGFCYIWQAQGGDRVRTEFTPERAIDTLATIWVKTIYWRS